MSPAHLCPSQNILTCQSLILRYFRSGAESRGEILPRHENSTISRRAVQLVGLSYVLALSISTQ
jgi:hypothetical protein